MAYAAIATIRPSTKYLIIFLIKSLKFIIPNMKMKKQSNKKKKES